MRASSLLSTLFRFLLPPTLIGVLYLYLYPVLQNCQFPPAKPAEVACYINGSSNVNKASGVPAEVAPFRLLALGDPQLEGDTSIPRARHNGTFTERIWEEGLGTVVTENLGRGLQGYRKRLDLWGNDLYLAHIYRSVKWWTQPTHTVVLGDLLGSQWIGDEEFARRGDRFWKRVFRHGEKVPSVVTDVSGRVEVLGGDERWETRIIAVAGNHDIGYAGDIVESRIERFEEAFGRVNWEIRFRLNDSIDLAESRAILGDFWRQPATAPELRLVILNSMNLDFPAFDAELQARSLAYLNEHITTTPRQEPHSATVLLTHIPLHKEAGICVDAPFFSYFPSDQGGGIKEQNQLTPEISQDILNGLSMDGTAVILNGHDHEGCDTIHASSTGSEDSWSASRYFHSGARRSDSKLNAIREITVRSMMGSFAGNAGLFSAWFDHEAGEWRFEYDVCVLGVQHIWWAGHVLVLIELAFGIGAICAAIVEELRDRRVEQEKTLAKKSM
nr:protein ted1 [Quercus suber]